MFLIAPSPQHPKVPPLEHVPGNRVKIPFIMYLSFICENTHKLMYKILWNWLCNLKLTFWPLTPRSPLWPKGEKFTFILFCSSSPSIWYATWPCSKTWPPGHPRRPKVTPLGHDPGDRILIPFWYVFYLSFVRTHTKFGIKNLWNWLCNWNL